MIKDGKPNFSTRLFVNEELKVAAFLSHIVVDGSFHKTIAKKMLSWAKKEKISLIVSCVAMKSNQNNDDLFFAGSTENARKKIKELGLKVLQHGTIPGIPGVLLNEGSITQQDVIVILINSDGTSPDFRASSKLCMAISQLIPGASCDMSSLQKQAELIEKIVKEDIDETRHLKDSMYR